MEFVKRHGFLLGLAAAVVVIGLVVGIFVQVSYRSDTGRLMRQLQATLRSATALRDGKIYSDTVVGQLIDRVKLLESRQQTVLAMIAARGRSREPLVKDLFPQSPDLDRRHAFKAMYSARVKAFMVQLNAVNPTSPADATEEEVKAKAKEAAKATMFAHPDYSFIRPDWVDKLEAPSFEECRIAQEDYWLMQDIVGIVAKLNADIAGQRHPTIRDAAVKELVEVRIGAQDAVLKDTGMRASGGRYLTGKTGPGARPESVTGRLSDPGFYQVLPWRLVVVARGNVAGELVRRLRDTESFLSVETWHMVPITPTSIATHPDLLAKTAKEGQARAIYGDESVVRLEIVGESLIFQLKGGRVTTPPAVVASQPDYEALAEAKAP